MSMFRNGPGEKVIVVVGPTASGKSELGVKLAKKFGGEVVSADSRQVYRGLDVGTGKVPRDPAPQINTKIPLPPIRPIRANIPNRLNKGKWYFHKGIRHHLLDVTSPKRTLTVAQYVKLAEKAISDIERRGKLPVIVGGTGFYIRALVDGITIPEVPPNLKLRARLSKKSVAELFQMLKEKDPERAATIERKNPRRLIRALEIVAALGKVPGLQKEQIYDALFIGIKKDSNELKQLIGKRFQEWLRQGFLKEVQRLRKKGVPEKRIQEFGLHYNEALRYLKKEISKEEFVGDSIRELLNYAKRQMTWFKRDPRIHWIENKNEAFRLVKQLLLQKI